VISSNTSAWYFSNTIVAAVVLLSLEIYGFYASLAGQNIFEEKLFGDDFKV